MWMSIERKLIFASTINNDTHGRFPLYINDEN